MFVFWWVNLVTKPIPISYGANHSTYLQICIQLNPPPKDSDNFFMSPRVWCRSTIANDFWCNVVSTNPKNHMSFLLVLKMLPDLSHWLHLSMEFLFHYTFLRKTYPWWYTPGGKHKDLENRGLSFLKRPSIFAVYFIKHFSGGLVFQWSAWLKNGVY